MRRCSSLLAGLIIAAFACSSAEAPALRDIRDLLAPARGKQVAELGPHGSTPAFTEIKHKLRLWIESQLPEVRTARDARILEHRVNTELRAAGISCDPHQKDCPRAEPGYLGPIKLEYGGLLVITTAVGITCGFDESAYAYSFSKAHWRPVWQSETNDYVEGKYVPQNFLHILLSPERERAGADPSSRLLLVLARDPAYCESNWYNVYYRVWRVRIDRPEEQLILDGGEEALLGTTVDGVVRPNDVLIEYSVRTAFTDFEVRRMVRHYIFNEGSSMREDPLALRPRDFVDEWMRTDWATSSNWTSPRVDPLSLQRMHDEKDNFTGGDYAPAMRCEQRPEHWQVALVWTNFDGKEMVETKHIYFLVRWLAPYRFSMSGVSTQPWSGCTEKDPASDEPRTLFEHRQ
ncbi:MAG TPA: hypothetical protein VFW44_21860 [Bryobacteraceae bacterium]|nr:hypothetical protein [Bryobacteraceae bacterium]